MRLQFIEVLRILTIACCTIAVFCAHNKEFQAVTTIGQTSIPYNRSVTGSDPLSKLPFNDSRLADTSGGLRPSQVRWDTVSLDECLPVLIQEGSADGSYGKVADIQYVCSHCIAC